jgi:hypothetical protein
MAFPVDAFAQPPLVVQPPAASRQTAPLPPATSAEPKVVEPAPGQAAAAAPAQEAIPITATCVLGEHHGVEEAEAKTAADIVCHELARRGATNTQHEVRFGKLGSRTMVTLASRNGNAYDERRTFVTGLDEINVAGPRLADALATGKPLEETRTVDNVLAAETTTSKVQRGSSAFDGGIFGMTAANTSGGTSAGFELGFTYRAGALGIGAHGRAGGIGSSTDKLSTASIDLGGRLYLSSGDFAPYFSTGLGLSHFNLKRAGESNLEGSGFGAFAAFGIEMLRTHHVGVMASLRADLPFYQLQGTDYLQVGRGSSSQKVADYVVPVSLNLGMMFH